jgi:small-conductance mechanosensitive channel
LAVAPFPSPKPAAQPEDAICVQFTVPKPADVSHYRLCAGAIDNRSISFFLGLASQRVLVDSVRVLSRLNLRTRFVLTVKAGIGYDVGWRTVHELMIQGARATACVLAEPAPEVWQSELSDYAVNYELRAFTNRADFMWSTLSLLRQNVLDAFNRAGVEIMTPSIFAHRDASHLAVPLEEFPNRPEPGRIAIDVKPK